MIYQEAIYVRATDWDGLYIGGTLADEGDSMSLPHELDGKTVKFSLQYSSDAVEDYIMDNGGFPKDYEELVALDK
jgi:hypothetical protein